MAKVRNPLSVTVKWNGAPRREVYLDSQVKANQWTVGAEVGVRFGRTLFHLLDNNPNLKMYAIDKDISQFYSKKIQEKYGARLVVLEGESWEQASNINESIDFVFIDAGHGTKSVVKDINAYRSLLKSNNGLLGHDVDFPAIQEALEICNILFDVCPDNVWHQKC
jgi:predicted O-methyltransferase YrrM